MTIEELKQTIEQRTGIPKTLLTGETAEEDIAQAKALLAFKKEHEAQRPKKRTAEQFSDWLSVQYGEGLQDTANAALGEIRDERSTAQQFADWLSRQGRLL